MSRNELKSSTFLRTQSYIANGMTNPDLKPPKKDGLTNVIKNNYNKKDQNRAKSKTSNILSNMSKTSFLVFARSKSIFIERKFGRYLKIYECAKCLRE